MHKKREFGKKSINLDLLLHNIKEKFNLSSKEIKALASQQEIRIPITIFSKNLGMLESISLYLHDELKLPFKLIAKLLQRNYKTIWTSYNKAKKK